MCSESHVWLHFRTTGNQVFKHREVLAFSLKYLVYFCAEVFLFSDFRERRAPVKKLDQVLIKMSLIVFEGLAEKWFFDKRLLIPMLKKKTRKTQEQWLCYSILIKDEILGQFSFKCCSQAHLCLFLS